ncbi:MAG: lamin tail domain-containing protein, partial [Planctomycetota bacterium]
MRGGRAGAGATSAAAALAVWLGGAGFAGVRINEIQSSNSLTIKDENGDASDWIELFNDGTAAVNLQGWGLSDTLSTPFRWSFGAVTLQPGQHLLVWASGKNRPSGPQVHTNFSISAGGEPVLLTQPDGTRADEYPSVPVARDTSMGRKPDGSPTLWFFAKPTPGAVNGTAATSIETLAQPAFSVPGGMYTGPVTVSVSNAVSGSTLRYTLDGSDPTESS